MLHLMYLNVFCVYYVLIKSNAWNTICPNNNIWGKIRSTNYTIWGWVFFISYLWAHILKTVYYMWWQYPSSTNAYMFQLLLYYICGNFYPQDKTFTWWKKQNTTMVLFTIITWHWQKLQPKTLVIVIHMLRIFAFWC